MSPTKILGQSGPFTEASDIGRWGGTHNRLDPDG